MVLAILGGVLLIVAVAIALDHARSLRRLRLARLLDDSRYAAAVDLLWDRQGTDGAFFDALDLLVDRGIERELACRNLTRLGFDCDATRLSTGRIQPTRPAADVRNPWERKPTPASSAAFIMPATSFGRGGGSSTLAVGPHS